MGVTPESLHLVLSPSCVTNKLAFSASPIAALTYFHFLPPQLDQSPLTETQVILPWSHRTSSGLSQRLSVSCLNLSHILIKDAVGFEPLHQDLHFLHLPEGQVWDDAKQALEHTRVGADKGAVDLVQEHHQLIFVTRQEEVALQEERMQGLLIWPGPWLQPTAGPERLSTSIRATRSSPRRTASQHFLGNNQQCELQFKN